MYRLGIHTSHASTLSRSYNTLTSRLYFSYIKHLHDVLSRTVVIPVLRRRDFMFTRPRSSIPYNLLCVWSLPYPELNADRNDHEGTSWRRGKSGLHDRNNNGVNISDPLKWRATCGVLAMRKRSSNRVRLLVFLIFIINWLSFIDPKVCKRD